jgi:hypothetical protein
VAVSDGFWILPSALATLEGSSNGGAEASFEGSVPAPPNDHQDGADIELVPLRQPDPTVAAVARRQNQTARIALASRTGRMPREIDCLL